MMQRLPIAVLASGSGTNLQAILDAARDPAFPAEVVVMIADRPGVQALDRAVTAGVPAEVVAWSAHRDRNTFTTAICNTASAHGARALILAGFLRILSPEAMERFPERIINIHPSLLPAFPGTIHAVREAIDHGAKVTGVTVHFVVEEVDVGPIIAQEPVLVRADDTEATLQARLQQVEHRLYPEVVAAMARDQLVIEGRRVVWKETQ